MKRFIIAGVLLGTATQAEAVTENNKNISYLGVQDGNIYVAFVESLSTTCAFNNLYVSNSTDKGKAIYATLLSACMAGKLITRIDYTVTSGTCYIDLVQI